MVLQAAPTIQEFACVGGIVHSTAAGLLQQAQNALVSPQGLEVRGLLTQTSRGPSILQAAWDAPAGTHAISIPNQVAPAIATVFVFASNRTSINAKLAAATLTVAVAGAELDVVPQYVYKNQNIGTFTLSASPPNSVVVGTDSDCCVCWTMNTAYI